MAALKSTYLMLLFNKISKVVIVEDHPIFMEGLKRLLHQYKFLHVVGEYIAPEFLIRVLPDVNPNIVFLDIHTDGMKGWDAVKEILKHDPSIRIVAMTQFSEGHVVNKMLEAGVCGYIVKTESKKELVNLFEKMDKNEIYISPVAEFNVKSGTLDLSQKEIDIIRLLAADRTNKAIASDLDISEKTLNRSITKICAKFGVSTAAGIVGVAYRLRILP